MEVLSTEVGKSNIISKQSDDRQTWIASTAQIGNVYCNEPPSPQLLICMITAGMQRAHQFRSSLIIISPKGIKSVVVCRVIVCGSLITKHIYSAWAWFAQKQSQQRTRMILLNVAAPSVWINWFHAACNGTCDTLMNVIMCFVSMWLHHHASFCCNWDTFCCGTFVHFHGFVGSETLFTTLDGHGMNARCVIGW